MGPKFRRSDGPLFDEVDGEIVMVDVEQGAYFALGAVGSRIWALLEQPRDLEEICHILTAEFDVEPDECRRQVAAFLVELREARLLAHQP